MSENADMRTPSPAEGGRPREVVIAPRMFDDGPVTVTLVPHRYSDTQWEVYYEGRWIGTVGRYIGSLDRKIGRLRSPGKRRTLWSEKGTGAHDRTYHGEVSRADAIRSLLRDAGVTF